MDLDVTSLLEAALQQGIWAALYIYLFFRMLKENASREERYQNMIDRLSSNIENGIENIIKEVCNAFFFFTTYLIIT